MAKRQAMHDMTEDPRYYHLTQEGHRALHEKEEAWNVYARAVGQVLRGGACCAGA